MADTSFGVNDPLAVQAWGKKLYVEALRKTAAMKFMGTGADALIQIRDELSSGPGSKVTFGLRMQLSGTGVSGDGVLEGNEEALVRHNDSVQIDQLRHAVKVVGNMSQQRVPFNIRSEAESGLSDWWAGRIDTSIFNQLGGNSAANGTGTERHNYTGMQAAVDPSSSRWIFADVFENGSFNEAGNDENNIGLDTAGGTSTTKDAPFRLELIDRCVVKARTSSPPIRPLSLNGMECYAMFLHPHQVLQLRQNSTAGQWLDIQKAAMTGGLVSKNAIFTGALGMYNNTILHEAVRVPYGNDTQVGADTGTDLGAAGNTTTGIARAIFGGAQAATVAFGRAYGWSGSNIRFKWTEVMDDYENQIGVSAALVWGCKKTVFNSTDFGTIVASTVSPGT
tara:strand:- start:9 stop:1187 length:1179 start_codon:yes stop_codon:yes gene_type:complete